MFPSYTPAALLLAEAFSAVGLLSVKGVRIIAEIWGSLEFTDAQTAQDSHTLTQKVVATTIERGLAAESAEQKHVDTIYHHWQMPMYNFEFGLIQVSRNDLEFERQQNFNFERSGW